MLVYQLILILFIYFSIVMETYNQKNDLKIELRTQKLISARRE